MWRGRLFENECVCIIEPGLALSGAGHSGLFMFWNMDVMAYINGRLPRDDEVAKVSRGDEM